MAETARLVISEHSQLQELLNDDHLQYAPIENGFREGAFDDSEISFVNGTRTLTLQPKAPATSFQVFSQDNLITVSSALTKQITDTEGSWFFYIDGAGVLQARQNFDNDLFTDFCIVAYVYWDAAGNTALTFLDERHGRAMANATHLYLHYSRGCAWQTGLQLQDFTVNASGDLDPHAQCSVENGRIFDEDLFFNIVSGSPQTLTFPAQIPLYYLSGSTPVWRKLAATTFPVQNTGSVSGRATWNDENAGGPGVWGFTDVNNSDFVLTHILAGGEQSNPIIGIIGQAEYNTLALARDGALTEIRRLNLANIFAEEWCPIGTIIFQSADGMTNTVKSKVVSTEFGFDYEDWRRTPLLLRS